MVINVYTDLDHRELIGVPVTLSRVGGRGDFSAGITPVIDGERLPAQVDVLRRAEDGSIRHALVTFVLPGMGRGGRVGVSWSNAAAPEPEAFEEALELSELELRLSLRSAEDELLVSDLGAVLRGERQADSLRSLHDGPLMRELEIFDTPLGSDGKADPDLQVIWRLRSFSGQSSVRVSVVVERCRMWDEALLPHRVYRDFSSLEIHSGERLLHKEAAYRHTDMARFRIVCWSGEVLENLQRRPDYNYLARAGFLPLYKKRRGLGARAADKYFTEPRSNQRSYQGPADDRILAPGVIFKYMPGVGGRSDIGPYPAWATTYLLTGAEGTYSKLLHADGNGGGAFYVHVRTDRDSPGYRLQDFVRPPRDPETRKSLRYMHEQGGVGLSPEGAHCPSIGYVSYLLTGDRFYAEELSFYTSWIVDYGYPRRGIMLENWQERHRAWAVRFLADAAFILPEEDPLQAYFTEFLDQNLERYLTEIEKLEAAGRRVHVFDRGTRLDNPGRKSWVNCSRGSVWQMAWTIWAMGNAAEKGFERAARVRDWMAEYLVGFYVSEDEFRAPDGEVYRWDPRDASTYDTAVSLLEVEPTGDGKGLRVLGKRRDIDNYGELWYYTKMNKDNEWYPELSSPPDADGMWPLKGGTRKGGWGHGTGMHHYGAWVGIIAACEAEVPGAQKAFETMWRVAGPAITTKWEVVPSEYLYMIPRRP